MKKRKTPLVCMQWLCTLLTFNSDDGVKVLCNKNYFFESFVFGGGVITFPPFTHTISLNLTFTITCAHFVHWNFWNRGELLTDMRLLTQSHGGVVCRFCEGKFSENVCEDFWCIKVQRHDREILEENLLTLRWNSVSKNNFQRFFKFHNLNS